MLEYNDFNVGVVISRYIYEKDGYLYLAGSAWEPPYDQSYIKKRPLFIKSDKAGNIIKKESFLDTVNDENSNALQYFIKTKDGNFIFNYDYIKKEGDDIDYEYVYYIDMVKFDENMNVQWKKNIVRVKNGWNFGDFKSKLCPTLDSGFYATTMIPFGDSMWLQKYEDRNIKNWPNIFYKYDKDGNIEWTDTMFNYKYPGLTLKFPRKYVTHIRTLKNGDMVGCGIIEEPVDPPITNYRGWLFSYDKEGDLKWEHYYQYNGNDTTQISDVIECGNGDLLCTGLLNLKNGPLDNRHRTWLFRVDSNGCYIPGCNLDSSSVVYTSTNDIHYTPVVNILDIYPNPVEDELNVEIPEKYSNNEKISWKIYDLNGESVKKGVQNAVLHRLYLRDLSEINKGVYFIVLKTKGKMIGVAKFIKVLK